MSKAEQEECREGIVDILHLNVNYITRHDAKHGAHKFGIKRSELYFVADKIIQFLKEDS